jgi:hypothetical protein
MTAPVHADAHARSTGGATTGAPTRAARDHRAMPLRAGILTLVCLLLVAAPARAAFDVTGFEVTPADSAAGAHADVTIATSFTPYAAGGEQPRNVTIHLPPGLAGDPFATPRCSEADYRADTCAAATRVGSVAAHVTAVAVVGLPGAPQDVTGDLYNLEPAGSEPARLGAVLRPLGGLLGKLFVPTVINARASDGGLDSVVTDLPRSSAGLQIYTERMAFTLQGRPAGGTGPFMRNPTSCKPATSTVEASSYQQPAVVAAKSASFTPTDCGALEFSPHIEGVVGANGQTARRAKPPVRTVVTQGAEQAGQSAVTVLLPPIIGPDLTQLSRACPPDKVALRGCPDSARIGTVEAATPLLAKPLTGSVYFAAKPVGQLPGLVIQLDDPIPLRLEGAVELAPTGIKTTFTGLPDVPLARFALRLAGGPSGAFQLAADVCAAAAPQVTASFVAQSGKQTAETRPFKVEGCTAPPRASARITKLRSGRPKVRLGVAAGGDAPALRTVRVFLPDALRVKPRRVRRGVRARTGAGALPRGAVELTRDGELRIALPDGARTVTATLAKGAVRVGRKLQRARKPRRLALRFLVTDAHGPREAKTLRVRPRRR